MNDDFLIEFVPPFQRDLPKPMLTPLYEATKPVIRQASLILATGVQPTEVFGPIPMPLQVEASALAMALALGNMISSSYATARDVYGRERSEEWLQTMFMWFTTLQTKRNVNLSLRIIERE